MRDHSIVLRVRNAVIRESSTVQSSVDRAARAEDNVGVLETEPPCKVIDTVEEGCN